MKQLRLDKIINNLKKKICKTVITWQSLKSRNPCVYEYHYIKTTVIYGYYIVVYILTQTMCEIVSPNVHHYKLN